MARRSRSAATAAKSKGGGKVLKFAPPQCGFCPRDTEGRCRRCRREFCQLHDYSDFCPPCDAELRIKLGPWYRVHIDKGKLPAAGDGPALTPPRAADGRRVRV